MSQTLYVMQGIPGSGKSTLAKMIFDSILSSGGACVICSTDNLFMVDGVYKFNPSKLGEYHSINLERSKEYMDQGYSVIVDNTNIYRKHCKPYVSYAVSKGIPVVFIRVEGRFKSIHGVPQHVIDKMNFEMEILDIECVMCCAD